jgi:hypothetical protein
MLRVEQAFNGAGLNLDQPFLNPGSLDNYELLRDLIPPTRAPSREG